MPMNSSSRYARREGQRLRAVNSSPSEVHGVGERVLSREKDAFQRVTFCPRAQIISNTWLDAGVIHKLVSFSVEFKSKEPQS